MRKPLLSNPPFQTIKQVEENMVLANSYVPQKQMRPPNEEAIKMISKYIMY